MKNVLVIFFSTRIFLFIALSIVILFIPYSGFFPYGEIAKEYHLPDILTKLANFDGVHYLFIAKEGYTHTFDQAYFPLYPLAIHFSSVLMGGNMLLAGILLSNIALIGILWLVLEFFTSLLNKKAAQWYIYLFLCFPTAFFLSTVYTESFFLFFFLLSLYFFQQKKYPFSFFASLLAALTRLTGLFLIVVFFTCICLEWYKKRRVYFSKEILLELFASSGSVVGFGIYAGYLFVTTGDPLFFFHAQPAFGAHRSTNLIFLPQVIYRYLKIFLTSDYNSQLLVSYLEFGLFLITFFLCLYFLYWVLQKKRYIKDPILMGLGIFSCINIVLPTLTGTLSSTPRYSLLSLSLFLPLVSIKSTLIKIFVGILFALLQILLFGFFAQGYFIS